MCGGCAYVHSLVRACYGMVWRLGDNLWGWFSPSTLFDAVYARIAGAWAFRESPVSICDVPLGLWGLGLHMHQALH